jgi:hypothetical protein
MFNLFLSLSLVMFLVGCSKETKKYKVVNISELAKKIRNGKTDTPKDFKDAVNRRKQLKKDIEDYKRWLNDD